MVRVWILAMAHHKAPADARACREPRRLAPKTSALPKPQGSKWAKDPIPQSPKYPNIEYIQTYMTICIQNYIYIYIYIVRMYIYI